MSHCSAMLKAVFPFLKWVYELPADKVDSLIGDTPSFIREDYEKDLVGFLQRYKKGQEVLLDEYNNELTERYFCNKLGEPPYITTAELELVLSKNSESAINLIYKIYEKSIEPRDQGYFWYMQHPLPSEDFCDLTLDNLLFKIMERIYENDDSEYWKYFFGENDKK